MRALTCLPLRAPTRHASHRALSSPSLRPALQQRLGAQRPQQLVPAQPLPAALPCVRPFYFPWQGRSATPLVAPGHAPRLHPPPPPFAPLALRFFGTLDGLQEQAQRPGAHADAVRFHLARAEEVILELLAAADAPQHAPHSEHLRARAAELLARAQWAARLTHLRLHAELQAEGAATAAAAPAPSLPPSRPADLPRSPAEQWSTLTAAYLRLLQRCGPQLLGRAATAAQAWAQLDPMLAAGVVPTNLALHALGEAARAGGDARGLARLALALPQLGMPAGTLAANQDRVVFMLVGVMERGCAQARQAQLARSASAGGGGGARAAPGGPEASAGAGALLLDVARAVRSRPEPPSSGSSSSSADSERATARAYAWALGEVTELLLKGVGAPAEAARADRGSSAAAGQGIVVAGELQKRMRLVQRLCLALVGTDVEAATSSGSGGGASARPSPTLLQAALSAAWQAELQLSALRFRAGSAAEAEAAGVGLRELQEGLARCDPGGGAAAAPAALLAACGSAHGRLVEELRALHPGSRHDAVRAALAGPTAALGAGALSLLRGCLQPAIEGAVAAARGPSPHSRELAQLTLALLRAAARVQVASDALPRELATAAFTALCSAGCPWLVGELLALGSRGPGGSEEKWERKVQLAQHLLEHAVGSWCGSGSGASGASGSVADGDGSSGSDSAAVSDSAGVGGGSSAGASASDSALRGTLISSLLLVLPDLAGAGAKVAPEALGRLVVLGVQQWADTLSTSCPACLECSSSSSSSSASASSSSSASASSADSGSVDSSSAQPLTRSVKAAMESRWLEVKKGLAGGAGGAGGSGSSSNSSSSSTDSSTISTSTSASSSSSASASASSASGRSSVSVVALQALQEQLAALEVQQQRLLLPSGAVLPTRRRSPRRARDASWMPPATGSVDGADGGSITWTQPHGQGRLLRLPSSATSAASASAAAAASRLELSQRSFSHSGCATLWAMDAAGDGRAVASLVPWALPPSRQLELLSTAGLLLEVPAAGLLAALRVASRAGCGREAWAIWREMCHRGLGQELLLGVSEAGEGSAGGSSGSGGDGSSDDSVGSRRALLVEVLGAFAAGRLQLPAWDVYMALRGRGVHTGPLPPMQALEQWARAQQGQGQGQEQQEQQQPLLQPLPLPPLQQQQQQQQQPQALFAAAAAGGSAGALPLEDALAAAAILRDVEEVVLDSEAASVTAAAAAAPASAAPAAAAPASAAAAVSQEGLRQASSGSAPVAAAAAPEAAAPASPGAPSALAAAAPAALTATDKKCSWVQVFWKSRVTESQVRALLPGIALLDVYIDSPPLGGSACKVLREFVVVRCSPWLPLRVPAPSLLPLTPSPPHPPCALCAKPSHPHFPFPQFTCPPQATPKQCTRPCASCPIRSRWATPPCPFLRPCSRRARRLGARPRSQQRPPQQQQQQQQQQPRPPPPGCRQCGRRTCRLTRCLPPFSRASPCWASTSRAPARPTACLVR